MSISTEYQNALTRYNLNSTQHNKKTGIGKAVNVIASESSDASTINNVVKVAKSGFSLLAAILPFEWLRNTSEFFNGVGNALKAAGIFKTPKDIKDNRNDGLKVASATLGGVSAVGAGAKILNSLKIIQFAKFSTLLGRIPLIGSVLAKFLPVSVVFNVVDVAKAGLDIAQASKKIHKLRGARQSKNPEGVRNGYREMKRNLQSWNEAANTGWKKEDVEARKAKLDRKLQALNAKRAEIVDTKTDEKGDTTNSAIDMSAEKFVNAFYKLNAKERYAKTHKHNLGGKLRKLKATRAFNKAGSEHTKLLNLLDKINAKITKREEELDQLNKLNYTQDNPFALEEDSEKKLKDFAKRKVERLKLKMSNNRWDQAKEGMSIALNILLAVTLIAVSILGGLALAGIAAVNLPVSASFLLISLIGIGLHFLKRYKKNHSYSKVPFEQELA